MLMGPSKCLKHIQHTGVKNPNLLEANQLVIEHFHSGVQHLCKFIGTKERVYIRKSSVPFRIDLEHQNGCHFIVLEHQYGRHDVMSKHSIYKCGQGLNS